MKYNYFILIAFFFFLCACQKEETRITNPSGPDVSDGSSIVSLLTSISLKDGSTDNAIDSTSRLSVNFPIEVSINDAPPITIS
ncbi:MAG TPA: hypothetical protein VFM70_12470, partial [Salinimicrobium sp.]|nr:hypothetical protein [Salinimicrobium sp.]